MYFTVVTENPIQGLQTQIPAFSRPFDPIKKLDTLNVVQKMTDAVGLTNIRQKTLAIMPERRMTNIVTQGDGFNLKNRPMVRAILDTN